MMTLRLGPANIPPPKHQASNPPSPLGYRQIINPFCLPGSSFAVTVAAAVVAPRPRSQYVCIFARPPQVDVWRRALPPPPSGQQQPQQSGPPGPVTIFAHGWSR